MKRVLLILALICGARAVAQEKEIWTCISIADGRTGFVYSNNRWEVSAFEDRNYLITIDGSQSKYGEFNTDCTFITGIVPHYRCHDSTGGTLLLNPYTGQAMISEGIGAVVTRDSRDAVTLTLLQCSKFYIAEQKETKYWVARKF